MTNNEQNKQNSINNYVSEKDESEKKETPMTKKRTDYKMVKVNNEIHKKLKMKSVETGFSMQEIAEAGIMKELNNM